MTCEEDIRSKGALSFNPYDHSGNIANMSRSKCNVDEGNVREPQLRAEIRYQLIDDIFIYIFLIRRFNQEAFAVNDGENKEETNLNDLHICSDRTQNCPDGYWISRAGTK